MRRSLGGALLRSTLCTVNINLNRVEEGHLAAKLAANLLGQSFNNLNSLGSWEVEAGEYVFGRVMDSDVGPGVAVVDLEVQLKGSRSNGPGLIQTRLIYVADAERALYWAVLTQDIGGR